MITRLSKKKLIICLVLATVIVILALGLGLGLGLRKGDDDNADTYRTAAVSANGLECAQIGTDILARQGSVADAAIAALFCEGVACPQSMGLGGGFLLTMYNRSTGETFTLNAREVAPGLADENMYENKPETASAKGGLAVAVPGELRGYWALHQRFGKLPWKDLVKPTIDLCRRGHVVSVYLARILKSQKENVMNEPTLKEIYINPETNDVWQEGDRVKRLKLAETLEIIAEEGGEAMHNGSLTERFVNDLKELGSIITVADMNNYAVKWDPAVTVAMRDSHTMYTTPLPGSGILLAYIFNILSGFLPDSLASVTTWQRMVETLKYAYAKRMDLGDYEPGLDNLVRNLTSPDYGMLTRSLIRDDKTHNNWTHYDANFYQPEDHGTAHISILAPNGDAIAVTSTINYIFGAMIRSRSTGIILNDEMDDFSIPGRHSQYGLPPSPANYIKPGKRPLSSMCPSILVDGQGDVRLVIGGAGGTKITAMVALITMRHLWFKESLDTAVSAKRIHHQLFPMELQYEQSFDKKLLEGLESIGHKTDELMPDEGFAALTAIARDKGLIDAVFDPRRKGSIAGF